MESRYCGRFQSLLAQRLVAMQNSLTDKVDSMDVFVTTDTAYKVASNGKLISEISSGNQKNHTLEKQLPYCILSYCHCSY